MMWSSLFTNSNSGSCKCPPQMRDIFCATCLLESSIHLDGTLILALDHTSVKLVGIRLLLLCLILFGILLVVGRRRLEKCLGVFRQFHRFSIPRNDRGGRLQDVIFRTINEQTALFDILVKIMPMFVHQTQLYNDGLKTWNENVKMFLLGKSRAHHVNVGDVPGHRRAYHLSSVEYYYDNAKLVWLLQRVVGGQKSMYDVVVCCHRRYFWLI
jgi:hypothetical protein